MIPKMSFFGVDTWCLPLIHTFEIRSFLFSLYGKHRFLIFYSRQARQKKKIAWVKASPASDVITKTEFTRFSGTWTPLIPLFYSHVKKLGALPHFLRNVRKPLVAQKALPGSQGRNQIFQKKSSHVSMLFSRNTPPSPSPTESTSLLVYCNGLYLSGLLHSV